MRGLALPGFKLLIAGALVAAIWAVRNDMPLPRPPEQVKALKQPKAVATVLPAAMAVRPPRRPPRGITGSVGPSVRPVRQHRTIARVRLRSQAASSAPVLSVLEAGLPVRELARSGEWRLVLASGHKGWVHARYLTVAKSGPPRPKMPVAARTAVHSAGKTLRKP